MTENLLINLEPYIRAVATILIHSLWQGLIIGILAAMVLTLIKSGSARIRYTISCGAMVTVLLITIVTAVSVWMERDNSSKYLSAVISRPLNIENNPGISSTIDIQSTETDLASSNHWWQRPSINRYIFMIWIVGVLLISFYHFIGWRRARGFARKGISRVPVEWQTRFGELCGELGIIRFVSFFKSSLAKVPCVVGWMKPVLLVPVSMFSNLEPSEIEMILIHELAHVRRYDVLVNMIQTTMETLFFFNPAIWWLSRQIRIERENCCDDVAVGLSGDRLKYARALANLEESKLFQPKFGTALTGASLNRRIRRIVGLTGPRFYSSVLSISGMLLFASFVAVLIGSIGAANNSTVRAEVPSETEARVLDSGIGDLNGRWKIESYGDKTELHFFRGRDSERSFSIDPDEIIEKTIDGRKSYQIVREEGTISLDGVLEREGDKVRGKGKWYFQPDPEYVRFMDAYGLLPDDTEKMLALAIFDVSRKFISGLEDLGYSGLDVDELISARIFNINSEIVNQFREAGYSNLSFDKLIAIRVQGVSPEQARKFEMLGFKNLTIDDLVSARIFGVTPELAETIRDAGYPDITFDKLIAMRVQGVNPGDNRAFEKMGFRNLSIDDLISAKTFGVTPEFIESLRDEGYPDVTFDKLISMRVQNVKPEDKRGFEKLGYKNLSIDNLISAKIFDVTPEFAEELIAADFRDLSFNSLIALAVFNKDVDDLEDCKRHLSMELSDDNLVKVCCHNITERDIKEMQEMGFTDIDGIIDMLAEEVTPDYIRRLSELGYSDLTPSELVRLHRHNVTPSFVRRLQREGLENLTTEDLIRHKDDRNELAARQIHQLNFSEYCLKMAPI